MPSAAASTVSVPSAITNSSLQTIPCAAPVTVNAPVPLIVRSALLNSAASTWEASSAGCAVTVPCSARIASHSECPAQRLRNIAHFASREAMDIDGLGISLCQSLIEAGLVHSPAELYALEPQSVAALDHMGKKSAENLMAAIEKSKDAGMARLLCAFGIRQVGQKAARVLAMHFGTLDKLMAATEEELMAIPDVGPTTAAYLRAWFDNPQSQHQIRLLRDAGVSFDSREQVVDRRFAGKTFVLTGALEHFSRDEASAIIERFGGKTSSSVSKKTSYLLAGENTGSKYQKALTLGTPIITEAEFLDMIQE